jgi:hypothetical protein
MISKDGGGAVRWRGDGKELFYQTSSGDYMSVDISTTPATSNRRSPTVIQGSYSGNVVLGCHFRRKALRDYGSRRPKFVRALYRCSQLAVRAEEVTGRRLFSSELPQTLDGRLRAFNKRIVPLNQKFGPEPRSGGSLLSRSGAYIWEISAPTPAHAGGYKIALLRGSIESPVLISQLIAATFSAAVNKKYLPCVFSGRGALCWQQGT